MVARLTASATRDRLAAALAELGRDQRDVLLLIAWGDLSYEETARAPDVPVGTVRSRLSRALRKIAQALGGSNPTDVIEEKTDIREPKRPVASLGTPEGGSTVVDAKPNPAAVQQMAAELDLAKILRDRVRAA